MLPPNLKVLSLSTCPSGSRVDLEGEQLACSGLSVKGGLCDCDCAGI